VQENLARRGAEIARAEAIVAEELARFMAWQRSRRTIPTVVALRQRFDDIRRAELQRLDTRLSGLPPEARARLDEVTRLIVEKLLLEPTEQLKALPDEETQAAYTEAVNRLFRLAEGEPPEAAAGDGEALSFDDTQDASNRRGQKYED
jgi:glutamyl-tRNA reductase